MSVNDDEDEFDREMEAERRSMAPEDWQWMFSEAIAACKFALGKDDDKGAQ